MAVGGTNERRYFTGVEGDKDKKGELFGLENLFSYRAEGASLSKDIIRRTEELEAGYKVAKYELTNFKEWENALEGEVTERSGLEYLVTFLLMPSIHPKPSKIKARQSECSSICVYSL